MIRALLTGFWIVAASGCASAPYWDARIRDALDVATVQVGYGLGMKARAGPLQTGLLMDVGLGGLRGGALLGAKDFWPAGADTPVKVEVLGGVVGFDTFWGRHHERGKDYLAAHVGVVTLPCNSPDPGDSRTETLLEFAPDLSYNPWPYFSQLELAGGIGVVLRLGVNPGEIVDLLAGVLWLDPFQDDGGNRPAGSSAYNLPDGFPFSWHNAVCGA